MGQIYAIMNKLIVVSSLVEAVQRLSQSRSVMFILHLFAVCFLHCVYSPMDIVHEGLGLRIGIR